VRRAFLLPLVLAAALPGCGTEGKAANDNGAGANTGNGTLPALTGRVVDDADLLPAAREARLTARLAALEKSTSDQLVVVTVPSLNGEAIEAFGLRAGRGWGIGQRDLDNGVLLIAAPTERRVRIEVGYGLEGLLTNKKAKAIIDQTMIPLFAANRHSEAIEAGADRIADVLEQERRRPQPLSPQKAA
jgi:uncharacterized protein